MIFASLRIDRFCALLGIALALVFAGSSIASAVDAIQHAPGAGGDHKHMVFSEFSVEIDDHADHSAPQPENDAPTDHLAGGHHHHGDNGSGLLALAANGAAMRVAAAPAYGAEDAAPAPRLTSPGPERPPRAFDILA